MLYHINVYWPENVPIEWNNISLKYSRHALERAQSKGIRLNSAISGRAFECEYIEGRLTKVALRCKYSSTHDLCIVISSNGIVITQWLNEVNDNHRTLNTSKYTIE